MERNAVALWLQKKCEVLLSEIAEMRRWLMRIGSVARRGALKVLLTPFELWVLRIVKSRLQFKLQALYWGLQLNRREGIEFNFRRNIHRLEKGLSRKDRRAIFAESYILETVELFEKDDRNPAFSEDTRIWGASVLRAYFEATQSSPQTASARALFCKLTPPQAASGWVPYPIHKRPPLTITYNQFFQLSLRRRSVRLFENRAVEPDVIEKAMRVAAQSPSACNRQAFKYLFFNQPDVVKRIAEVPGGVQGYDIPSVIIIVGSYRGYFDARDANAPIIDSSLAAMAFLFALETLGLSSVCINWPSVPEKDRSIRKIIELEKDEFVIMLIGIGYPSPDAIIPFSAKRPLSELLLINERIRPLQKDTWVHEQCDS